MIGSKFKQNDYIVNHASGDLAIVSHLDKNGYYHFKAYYGAMFKNLNDVKGTNFHYRLIIRNSTSYVMMKRKNN